jgi:hypothetical protein
VSGLKNSGSSTRRSKQRRQYVRKGVVLHLLLLHHLLLLPPSISPHHPPLGTGNAPCVARCVSFGTTNQATEAASVDAATEREALAFKALEDGVVSAGTDIFKARRCLPARLHPTR